MSAAALPVLHATGAVEPSALILVLLPGVLWAYVSAARRLHAAGRRWNGWRIAAFAGGIAVLAASASPLLAWVASPGFAAHAVEHVLLGMLGPALLVVAAPMTLLLASLPRRRARFVARFMRTRFVATIGHPAVAAVLSVGGMVVLYATPLYAAMLQNELLHFAVHLHLFAAGYLFAWAIAGIDPAPQRASFAMRTVVLVAAAAAHAGFLKVMYARGLPADSGHSLAELRGGLQWMYYGGDVAEVVLACALFAAWYRQGKRPRGAAGAGVRKGSAPHALARSR